MYTFADPWSTLTNGGPIQIQADREERRKLVCTNTEAIPDLTTLTISLLTDA